MGQVLGFSHCSGNEESDFPELQTAREWSEEEDGIEDEEGGASSPSVWGTPRQNSFELTFSYIAFSEPEGGGPSRRDSLGGSRRRGGSGGRGSRPVLSRTDTSETVPPLDSPQAEWNPHDFLAEELETKDELEDEVERREGQPAEPPASLDLRVQRCSHAPAAELQDESPKTESSKQVELSQLTLHHEPLDSHQVLYEEAGSLVAMETANTLLMEVQPGGGITDVTSSTPPSSIGQNTQEAPGQERWFSTLNLSEDTSQRIQTAILDLIYWRDMERTGVVFTGLVVGLLSLFQLSIVTVVSTLSLAVVCCTVIVRVYYHVLHALQWGDGVHPFKWYLDYDISLSGEKAEHHMQRIIVLTVSAIAEMKRILFVGNLIDSLKYLVLAYLLTFVGAIFNGLTLLIIGVISLFSLPLFYKQRQVQVDSILTSIKAHVDNIKDIFHRLLQGGCPAPDPTPGGAKPKIK
ncbi:reticulon-2a isoform X2 [Scleropages formosus]|uniref:Reticulon n=1 Tax=Scleropages formosus TaxID=113540 RepID=A0A8C9R7M0_SCLFO|nr:reticulon-2-like isoform X2 [Scleropages formosus]